MYSKEFLEVFFEEFSGNSWRDFLRNSCRSCQRTPAGIDARMSGRTINKFLVKLQKAFFFG